MTGRYCLEIPLLLLFFHLPLNNLVGTKKTVTLEMVTVSVSQCGKMKCLTVQELQNQAQVT